MVISALGLTTAASQAISGLVDWSVTGLLVAGGVASTLAGLISGKRLAAREGVLERGSASVVIAEGGYGIASSI